MKINKKIFLITSIILLNIILISFVFAAVRTTTNPSVNVCCEKTKTGAWCQNSLENTCDTSVDELTNAVFRKTPTSCDATSFCKPGCCIDSQEGLCMENTPQRVCQESLGTWLNDAKCNVPQCKLGCCILGDQASFVTLTRCKRLSSLYGLKTNFQKDVNDEGKCILMAYYQDKGACVYEVNGEKTCKFTSRQECLDSVKSAGNNSKPDFYKDYLCSADELGTNCGPTKETMCIPGKDELYFKDSCGNPANIYDASKLYEQNPSYWKKIVLKSESCGYGNSNINSKTCGNCNYLKGSICGEGTASYGNYVCKDVNCYNTQNGRNYKNGESWCEYQGATGNGQDAVGSRHFRHVCVFGEETIEPCADFRNEICIEENVQSVSANFIEAACRPNRWKDCIDQVTEKSCSNKDKRDCYWISGYKYDGAKGNIQSGNGTSASTGAGRGIVQGGGICLPNVPPGLKFWDSGEANAICSIGNSLQVVNFTKNIFGTKKCKDNCEALESGWPLKMNEFCTSLGDCGAKSNIAGAYTDDGILYKLNGNITTPGVSS